MRLVKQVTLNDLKNKTESSIEKINLLMKSVALNAREYIDNAILFANMEIEHAENNGIDETQMSEFAQRLKKNPNIQIQDGASLFQFLTGNVDEEYSMPMILIVSNDEKQDLESSEASNVEDGKGAVEKIEQKPRKKINRRKSIVLDTLDIDGFEFKISIKAPKEEERNF